MMEGKVVLEERLEAVVFLILQEEGMMKTGISNAKIALTCNRSTNATKQLWYRNELPQLITKKILLLKVNFQYSGARRQKQGYMAPLSQRGGALVTSRMHLVLFTFSRQCSQHCLIHF